MPTIKIEESRRLLSLVETHIQQLHSEVDGWKAIVKECEKILGCEDTADEYWRSNLPNILRDLISRVISIESIRNKKRT